MKNPDKTDGGEWVSAYECDPLTVDAEFLFAKSQYDAMTGRDYGEHDVVAYHLRQSFKPGEIDPAAANRISYELAMRLTKGKHAFICCTHVDKAHIHTHIIFNSTSLDCTRKFRNFYKSSFVIRRISDQLCLENGLSVIKDPKPSKGRDYGDWLAGKTPGLRDKLMGLMDDCLRDCKSYNEFLQKMQAAGVKIKQGKSLSLKAPGQARFIRCKSLDDDYTDAAIRERISGKRIVAPKEKVAVPSEQHQAAAPQKPTSQFGRLLIDIQAKIQEGAGPGFEQWAKVHNVKEAAKTLLNLQERKITDYEVLAERADAAKKKLNDMSTRSKIVNQRLPEIVALQRNIGTYSKTLDVYRQYRDSKWDKKFYAAHADAITAHKAAKRFFDEQKLEKLPRMETLKTEYATLAAEKKKLDQGIKPAREDMIALLTAKQTIDTFLGGSPTREKGRANSGPDL